MVGYGMIPVYIAGQYVVLRTTVSGIAEDGYQLV